VKPLAGLIALFGFGISSPKGMNFCLVNAAPSQMCLGVPRMFAMFFCGFGK
jgi:hypothetical protein